MDLRFYHHTLEVTEDFEKVCIVEAREQDAYGKYLYLKDDYIGSLYINRTHYSQGITNIATFR